MPVCRLSQVFFRSKLTPGWIALLLGVWIAPGLSLRAENASSEAEWTQWRGPDRRALVTGSPWPDQLTGAGWKQLWRVALGPSYSGPLVIGDRVIVTETRDKKIEVVRALERATGREIWSAQWDGSLSVPFFAKSNGDWIRATPAYDQGRLYVAGMRDVLVCLNADNGQEVWRVDFVKELGTAVPAFGFVSSPLIVGDFLYVQAGASFAKLEKATGKIVWRVLEDGGGMNGSAFSSPTLETLHGVQQLLVQTRTKLAGVDPDQGKVLWTHEVPAFRGMNILSPTVVGDAIFTSSYGGRSFLYQIKRDQEQWSTEEAWSNKIEGYMSTPVVIDGHAYLHLRNQRFACLDLASGKEKWITKPYGKYWSMVAQGQKILALDERGELLLIRANPEKFDLLDTVTVSSDDPTWAHLAVCGQQIFIRELNAMAVYRWGTVAP